MFFDGGRRALVSRDGDHKISLLPIDGETVTVAAETLHGPDCGLIRSTPPARDATPSPRTLAVADAMSTPSASST